MGCCYETTRFFYTLMALGYAAYCNSLEMHQSHSAWYKIVITMLMSCLQLDGMAMH